MTKKAKTRLGLGIAFSALLLLVLAYCISLFFYNPFRAREFVRYFSDDSNYHRYTGVIQGIHRFNQTSDETIGYLELSSVSIVDDSQATVDDDFPTARIFSNELEQTWTSLSPKTGLQIDFICAFFLDHGHAEAEIVQITSRGEEILQYADGKSALIEWAKTLH